MKFSLLKPLPLVLLLSLTSHFESQGQQFEPTKYFAAVVVSDVTSATDWYTKLFDLRLKDEINDPNGSYKINILESSKFSLELLQLAGSIPPNSILKGKPEGTQIRGHFKIGFEIKNVDDMLAYLKKANIDVPRIWTDAKTKKRNFLIHDPDGNLIQFFEN